MSGLRAVLLCMAVAAATGWGQTGVAVAELAALDQLVPDMLSRWHMQGASVAVAKDGRLVFARGYGMADAEAGAPVEPESLFRISSISKLVTAVGVMRLVEEGRLDLDAKAFRILDHLQPPPGATPDPRLYEITVRQLLQHTAGFDANAGGVVNGNDPLRPPMADEASRALGAARPASAETIIRYMMGRPLDFDPGTRFAYSGFGFCVLGRVIEKITGEPYTAYIQRTILGPLGIARMRIGSTRRYGRAAGEVQYYNYPSMPLSNSVFGEGTVPFPWGGYSVDPMDASGGWIGSAMDLVRFASALDGRRGQAPIQSETLRSMFVKPQLPAGGTSNYGLGLRVETQAAGVKWWHDGGTPYTASSHLATMPGGISVAILVNGHNGTAAYYSELDSIVDQAVRGVLTLPTHDLFAKYYAQDAPVFPAGGVVNAASYAPGAVAPGEIVTIFGERLGPGTLALAGLDADGRMAKEVAGTRVLFDEIPAPLIYTWAGQVSAIVPYALSGRTAAALVVEYQGARSSPVAVQVTAAAPGLFQIPVTGERSGWITLYATGEGQTAPAGVDGAVATEVWPKAVQSVEAQIGGQAAEVMYAGAAPGMVAGVMQVNLRVPVSVQPGAAVPVVLRVGAVSSPPMAIAVR